MAVSKDSCLAFISGAMSPAALDTSRIKEAGEFLARDGYETLSVVDLVMESPPNFKHVTDDALESSSREILNAIFDCNFMVVVSGWEYSSRSRLEAAICSQQKKGVYQIDLESGNLHRWIGHFRGPYAIGDLDPSPVKNAVDQPP